MVAPSGPRFLEAFNAESYDKDAKFLAERLKVHIDMYGAENVVCCITDSATANEAAARELQKTFPGVFWVRCSTHGVNLMLKDVGKLGWAAKWLKKARQCVKFLRNHHKPQALVRMFSSRMSNEHKDKELLSPGNTRFGTSVLMLGRLLELKPAILAMLKDAEWFAWARKPSVKKRAAWVQKVLLNKEFWDWATRLVDLLTPIMSLLRQTDTAKPSMGHVLQWILRTRRHIEEFDFGPILDAASLKEQILKIFNGRWKWMRSPLHSVGWLLNPQHFSEWHTLQQDASLDDSKKRLLSKLLKDRDEVFRALLGQDELVTNALKELAQYFARSDLCSSAGSMSAWEPWLWWSCNGGHLPTLQKVATRVLAQPSSASASENNWSVHDFIINRRRNKLSVLRANDLVFVFSNLKLVLHMNTAEYKDVRHGMNLEAADVENPMMADGDITDPEEDPEHDAGGDDKSDEEAEKLSSEEPSDIEKESEMVSSDQPASSGGTEDVVDGSSSEPDTGYDFAATAAFEDVLVRGYVSSPEVVKRAGRPKGQGAKKGTKRGSASGSSKGAAKRTRSKR
uniref:DUF659 domain-containing protein n=1 Tax=Chlamydomonas euryale TaxID=1486919 RepID=A0A6U2CN76_9CHLO|mmetsp:Transcript_15732/g.46483  ORF Transcript_15732/g.46483 Transcript_15732/m.46483 type:complete len:567 (-) Transcript_15732:973-2673(-)